jgi:imidazolonepropionase-like amidohydrolase
LKKTAIGGKMSITIRNGTVVVGDGKTVIKGGLVRLEGEVITEVSVSSSRGVKPGRNEEVIDARGKLVIPGVINHHAHGISYGPLFASGAPPLPRDQVKKNLDRHLLEGTTTILCADGFVTAEEVSEAGKSHPIRLLAGTTHTPKNFAAADVADGTGLQAKHRNLTVEIRLSQGAPAIGEVGAGATLGGGVQDYKYIPEAIKKETGKELKPSEARELKFAVLGRHISREAFNASEVKRVLEKVGLADLITVERVRELIEESVLPPFKLALEGFEEALSLVLKHRVPGVFHNAAASAHQLIELAKSADSGASLIVAAHSNHPTFETEEAVRVARSLKDLGVVIDVSTLDGFVNRYLGEPPDNFYAILEAGLADTVTTDYAGGHHDSILTGLQHAITKGVISLPRAIALATGNVARIFPSLAPNRGLLKEGKIADVVITDGSNLARVDTVIIGGRVVVRGGSFVEA